MGGDKNDKNSGIFSLSSAGSERRTTNLRSDKQARQGRERVLGLPQPYRVTPEASLGTEAAETRVTHFAPHTLYATPASERQKVARKNGFIKMFLHACSLKRDSVDKRANEVVAASKFSSGPSRVLRGRRGRPPFAPRPQKLDRVTGVVTQPLSVPPSANFQPDRQRFAIFLALAAEKGLVHHLGEG